MKRDRARDIMSTPAVVCGPHATLAEVVDLLVDREVSGLPVVDDDGAVVGIISERDLARALGAPVMRLAMHGAIQTGPFLRHSHGESLDASRIMSSPVVSVDPDTPLREVAATMVDHQVNRLAVVEGGRLVGVVTRGDILGAVAGRAAHVVERSTPPLQLSGADPKM